MRLSLFSAQPTCTECSLHAGAASVGVPTVRYFKGGEDALVCLGQNPGYQEDRAGLPFVGPSGKLLKRVYLDPLLRSGVQPTIYLMNAARCGPGKDVPDRSRKTCFARYGVPDMDWIGLEHRRTCVLCLGAVATTAYTESKLESPWNLSQAFSRQPHEAGNLTAYFTYHPAYLLRNRKMAHVVADHMELVRKFFLNEEIPVSCPVISTPRPPRSVSTLRPMESLDTPETDDDSHPKPGSTRQPA